MGGGRQATAVLALALAMGVPTVASAAEHAQVVQGSHLTLVSVLPDSADRLSPGVTVNWLVGISAPGADSGSIERSLQVEGDLADYLLIGVAACTAPSSAGCTGGHTLLGAGVAGRGADVDLGSQDAAHEEWLRIQVRLPEEAPAATQSLTGSVQLTARGAGEELAVTPGGDNTGGSGSSTDQGRDPDQSGSTERAGAIDPPLVGWLPGTGVQPALWLLAAGSAVLLGVAMRSQRREHPAEDDANERSRR